MDSGGITPSIIIYSEQTEMGFVEFSIPPPILHRPIIGRVRTKCRHVRMGDMGISTLPDDEETIREKIGSGDDDTSVDLSQTQDFQWKEETWVEGRVISALRCLRCGNVWRPRSEQPGSCPNCKRQVDYDRSPESRPVSEMDADCLAQTDVKVGDDSPINNRGATEHDKEEDGESHTWNQ